ncbi:MAG: thiol:disulfide interchange protein DsbA/DsbL [Deltaproteobacteria bacterium]|jgi:thiol:disulfide interchange protein DsbA|nr:thiol:disulfide interchange protein DsbA/DsbL [Deltaproteobacteria bacterium]
MPSKTTEPKSPSSSRKLAAAGVGVAVAVAVFLALFLTSPSADQTPVLNAPQAAVVPAQGSAPPAAVPAQGSAPPPAAQAPIAEGADYKVLSKPGTLTPDTPDRPLELVYVFWYGCGTCRRIDSTMDQYSLSLPRDVRSYRIPAMYEPNELWMNHARLFYALDVLGKESELHSRIFEAVQDTGPPDASGHIAAGLANFDEMASFAERNGISRADFEKAWNSPETASRFQAGLEFINNMDLDSVPAIGVNGRFAVPISRGGVPRFLDTANKLLADERARIAPSEG